ncbi:MAG: 16S rRNA (uracil1498-N3)-methyltransferase [Marivirga sp.]|jgi:16S rRNA (uracil1498-N3)-methyltransferase
MNIFYQPALPETTYLDHEESKHCIKVLRKQVGDTIQIINGKGNLYEAKILAANHKKCSFQVLSVLSQPSPSVYKHIAIAPTKNIDRIEWFVEKAVEIGIDEISFIRCHNSERSILKTDRIIKKAISAMKQSYKYYLPKINELISYSDLLKREQNASLKTIAYVDFENPTQLQSILAEKGSVLTLIGPEGDFSAQEIKQATDLGYIKVALGNSRLRTETAGIVACHLMMLASE